MKMSLCLCAFVVHSSVYAGEPPAAAPAVKLEIKDEELKRVPVVRSQGFPWVEHPPTAKPASKAAGAVPDKNTEAPMDLTNGELIIKADGDFSREEKVVKDAAGEHHKEILTLNKDVQIEQLDTQSVLRGQKIKVVRDLKTGDTEMLEAQGNVELVTPERKGKGDYLLYETQYGPHHEVLKDMYTIDGNRKANSKAVLWQGDDVIEAARFVSDRRLDTFRAIGGPAAVVTLPAPSAGAAGSNTAAGGAQSSGGMMPSLSLSGGKIRLQADGEMFFEGANGKVTLTRNVVLQQQASATQGGMKMTSDQALLLLAMPPPGMPAQANSVFEGSLKRLEAIGRVEIKTASQVVLCDKATLDMDRKRLIIEMNEPKDSVRVYIPDDTPGANPSAPKTMKVMIVPKSMTINTETNEFEGGGAFKMDTFTGTAPPTNRSAAVPASGAPKDANSSAAPVSK